VYCIGKIINRYLELQLKQMDSDIQCITFVRKVLLDATLTEIDTTGCNGGPFLPEGSPTNNNHSILERFGEN